MILVYIISGEETCLANMSAQVYEILSLAFIQPSVYPLGHIVCFIHGKSSPAAEFHIWSS